MTKNERTDKVAAVCMAFVQEIEKRFSVDELNHQEIGAIIVSLVSSLVVNLRLVHGLSAGNPNLSEDIEEMVRDIFKGSEVLLNSSKFKLGLQELSRLVLADSQGPTPEAH